MYLIHYSYGSIFHKDVKLLLLVPESLDLITRLNYEGSSDSSGECVRSYFTTNYEIHIAKRNEILRALDRAHASEFCNSRFKYNK